MEKLLLREVFVPLGFHANAWSRDVNGHTVGGTGLYLRTEDMAKIGWLYLNRGAWGDRRIFSEAWADIFPASAGGQGAVRLRPDGGDRRPVSGGRDVQPGFGL
ncbi:MAG: hypothetical protein L6V84_06160 [Oscillospiraceae bacterium]|nr:MAG: hypothetical protein L6V84_06160 [Oscillospiraceae bacterium]